jgi:hypothetical protein
MIKKIVSVKSAGNILLILFSLLIVFHVLVLLRVFPSNMVWGGRAAVSPSNLVLFEIIALLVLILFMLIIAAKTGYFKIFKSQKALNVCIWIIFAYMLLNAFANLASSVAAERIIFLPFNLVMAVLVSRLGVE